MPYRKKDFFPGGYYHIYNRGANRAPIFFSNENYTYCLKLIRKSLSKHDVTIIVYCLMPNHYHFILRQNAEDDIANFIRDVFNPYVQAVNIQQHRKGTLFEGRFKHILIEKDEHILHLCRYIHLNPVKARLVSSPEFWLFSNYLDWIGEREGTLTDLDFMVSNFQNGDNYRDFVMEYLVEKNLERKIWKYILEE